MTLQIASAMYPTGRILGVVDGEVILVGDTYCIKHQELLTLGFDNEMTCAYCEWGDE